ncbi:myeloid cell surface antigen CD33-like isoform X1 [Clarias magur]|uniref:Myeloid cell surface antigen CD33-like isoform X1 n=1 Tax=Clarias magur TaxID=1594786 RepID=A0A8J4T403_CLAMG|nr:myeloid cell surface antigen CD33-like isoform X1 [Clarias magur]
MYTHCVLTQDNIWGVNYPDKPICAVRGFSVSIPCSYYYPTSNYQVTQKLWCSMNSNKDVCTAPPYVYDSSSNTTSDFEFVGDDKSNCTLLIHNVQFSYSGEYKFRFITNVTDGRLTGDPGVTLQTADLKVSLIRLSGNGTLKQGDSLNLTCDVTCTHSSSQFVWSKNNEQFNISGPVLHFPALTVRDSGSYTCTWKTNTASGSKTISLQVEGDSTEDPENLGTPKNLSIWMVVLVTAGVMFMVFALPAQRFTGQVVALALPLLLVLGLLALPGLLGLLDLPSLLAAMISDRHQREKVSCLSVISGVLTQDSGWRVNYPDKSICAVRGFSVSIPCSYYYPKVQQVSV